MEVLRILMDLCKGIRPPLNKCSVYDTKQSDDEDPDLEL